MVFKQFMNIIHEINVQMSLCECVDASCDIRNGPGVNQWNSNKNQFFSHTIECEISNFITVFSCQSIDILDNSDKMI